MRRRTGVAARVVAAVAVAVVVVALPHASSRTPHTPTPQASTRPHRIVSLVPAVTEMLFAVDAGNEVVGVSSFDHFPPAVETRTRVGALVDPDFERIMSLRPDLVVVYGTQTDLMDRLARAKLPIFRYQLGSLADVTATIRQLGARIGRSSEADREVKRIDDELEAIRASTRGRPRPRTALVFGRDPGALRGVFVSGGIGFMHDMLVAAGGDDVFADVQKQSLQASTELLLSRAPEVIIEVRPDEHWSAERVRQEVAVWNALPALPAVRTGRVYILADDKLLVPGPRIADATRLIANALK